MELIKAPSVNVLQLMFERRSITKASSVLYSPVLLVNFFVVAQFSQQKHLIKIYEYLNI